VDQLKEHVGVGWLGLVLQGANVLNIIGKLLETARRIKEALVNVIKGGIAFLKSIPTRVELLVTMVDTVNGAAHTARAFFTAAISSFS
jgi:hypothetical protein